MLTAEGIFMQDAQSQKDKMEQVHAWQARRTTWEAVAVGGSSLVRNPDHKEQTED